MQRVTYNNPEGSPDVLFGGQVSFTEQEIADACRTWGPRLLIPHGAAIDGTRLLWALAGNESSFGANCRPRHEMGYCIGPYSRTASVVIATEQFGHAAHCSFGPWQMMLVNADPACDPELFGRVGFCALKVGGFLNVEIFQRQQASSLEEVGAAYNTGNFRDKNKWPVAYIAKLMHNYNNVPMPEAVI